MHQNLVVIVHDMMIICCVFLQGGYNVLHCAAMQGHVNVIDWLCKRYPNMITQTDHVSEHKICYVLNSEMIKYRRSEKFCNKVSQDKF